jgi:hypothetical protein
MIEAFLTTEFLSLIGGSLVGFIFKTMAERRQDEKERFERTLSLIDKRTEVANAAARTNRRRIGKDCSSIHCSMCSVWNYHRTIHTSILQHSSRS